MSTNLLAESQPRRSRVNVSTPERYFRFPAFRFKSRNKVCWLRPLCGGLPFAQQMQRRGRNRRIPKTPLPSSNRRSNPGNDALLTRM
jgi:hypothetical protein